MTTKAVPTSLSNSTSNSKIADFVELTKPRISIMILITVAIAGFVGATSPSMWLLFNTLVGVLLVSASGSALNQFMERYTDWLMPRTAGRPLPGQRLSSTEVALFGAITVGMGISYLILMVNWQSAVVAGITWVLYTWVYTPLKVVTSLNTYVGAVAGAMPVLIGVVAQEERVTAIGWSLFAILFVWQFPHFMAIAWKYRKDYAEGGLVMFPVSDPSGRSTGWHALIFAIAIFPASFLAVWLVAGANWWFLFVAALLGLLYLVPSVKFWRERNPRTSRQLLLASLIYLPFMLLVILIASLWSPAVR